MPRYRLTIEYDGGSYVGWQRQENGPSVQAAIEAAVLAISGEAAPLHGAGRTDAGVHAAGQVAHFDLERAFPAARLANALNAHLRDERIAVLEASEAEPRFHARFSAIGRRYRYLIINRRAPLAIEAGRAWRVRRPLDVAAMREGAALLLGTHDFTTFRAAHCQSKSAVKTLDRLDVERDGETITIEAAARSFLHHQVRSMVGSLVEVGAGRWNLGDLAAALETRDRRACGPVAPPEGLTLTGVDYPEPSSETASSEASASTTLRAIS